MLDTAQVFTLYGLWFPFAFILAAVLLKINS